MNKKRKYINYSIHLLLFVLSFFTCMIAGVFWDSRFPSSDLANIGIGFEYAALIMFFLFAHEMGHYIAARLHKVDSSLPFFIPFLPPPIVPLSFGTMGAIIKIRTQIPSRKALLDIGAAGPIAGFIVCIIYLIIGLVTLPTVDYYISLHKNFSEIGA